VAVGPCLAARTEEGETLYQEKPQRRPAQVKRLVRRFPPHTASIPQAARPRITRIDDTPPVGK
jgi:hypothetical protein